MASPQGKAAVVTKVDAKPGEGGEAVVANGVARPALDLIRSGEIQRFTAAHEAGHAVLGVVCGLEVIQVNCRIQPWGNGELAAGATQFRTSDGAQESLVIDHPEVAGPVLLAGCFAERALLGGQYMVEGYSGDLKIWKRGMMRAGADHRSSELAAQLISTTQRWVMENRTAIAVVAAALGSVGRLTGNEVQSLVKGTMAPRGDEESSESRLT